MQALIDTGASQNYMAPSTANSLGLKSKASETKSVVLADGKTVTTNKCVTTEFLIEAADTSGTKQILFCDKCGAQHLDSGWYSKYHTNGTSVNIVVKSSPTQRRV